MCRPLGVTAHLGVCAIIGGVFTVSSLLDGAVYRGLRTFQAKVELGKET
jgi:hypothetical protein